MDSSVAIAAAYLQLNRYFVLSEVPVQVAERHAYARDLFLRCCASQCAAAAAVHRR